MLHTIRVSVCICVQGTDEIRIGGVVVIPKWEVELIRTKGKNVRRKHK